MRPPSSSTAMRTTAHGDEDYILRGHPIQEAPPPAPGVETLADLFETQAQRQPTAPLFSFAHPQPGKSPTTVSYGQAYQRTLAASQRLFSLLDRQQGAVVGVWLERSIELHLALLGVAFSGAGWLPFDADAPAARVRVCLQDSKAAIILCDQAHLQAAKEAVQGSGAAVVTWDELQQGATVESVRPCRPQGIDTAYMIYTSGSTGTPKGIAISHGAALTFALSEQSILRTGSNDVVWQGFSAAFDMFIEETWVSIAGGAHLVVGSRDECRNVSGLGGADGLWAQRGVTVVNAVPTLINIMTSLDDDARLPASVRLLNLGGEACPGALVGRLWHKDLRIINTYGPSETTVTATFQELLPGQIVTIGKPLPGYHALLLPITDDYAGKEVPTGPVMLAAGAEGELCIGGPCLAKGYVGREALTAEKFVAHPCVTCEGERMYRTGDRVRLDSDLNLLFLGRIDTQVKHRGFRIELGEIESALSAHDDVQTAAVILSDVTARLEAYVVGKRAVEVASLRRSLAALPTYMQPEAFFFLAADEMPRLPSGKINAKALQLTSQSMASASGEGEKAVDLDVDESSPLGVLLRALSAVFPQAGQVLPTSDFFDDLGGHSLAAAMLVSKLRKESGPDSPLASLGLQDIYRCRTAQHLVDKFAADDDDDYDDMHDREGSKKHTGAYLAGGATGQKTGELWPVSRRAHVLCGIAQLPALLLLFFFSSVELLVPYVVFFYVLRERNVGDAILATYAAFAVIPPLMTLVGIAGKWLVLGRAKAGEYPLYGVYYYRFWLAERFVDLIKFDFVADSPLHPSLMRILGAHVGTFCHIGSVDVGAAYDLVDIGHDVVIGQDVTLATSVVERGRLILKHIRIESDAHIASSCVLEGGACVLDGGELAPLSMLADGATVPPFQRWHGSPATFLCDSAHAGLERATRPSLTRKVLLGLSMAFSAWFLFPILYFAPQIPSLLLFEVLDIRTIDAWAQTAAVAMPASLAYILLVFAEMVAFRWLILGTVKPGSHGTTSLYYFRHWFVQNLMTMSLDILKPVYATVYVVPFLRSLGVKIGTWAEVSTARGVQFGLTEIGDESFIADKVLMGSTSIRGNALHLEKTVLSARAFAGNNAVIPQGTRLGSNSLVGVMSIAPDQKTPLQDGQSCFGSPPVLMPARQQDHAGHADHLLYNPRPSQVAHRLLIEGLRIWLPRAIIVFGLGFGLQICEVGFDSIGALYTLLMLPLFYIFLFALPALLFTILVKWTLIGRYSTAEWPLWSRNVWLSEFVTSVHETLLYPLLTRKLVGTPLLPMCFRLLGVKIGARVTMLSSTLTEYDMITLGDEAVLNHHTGPQTHLFEDRIMKVGTVELEARACMKPNSICLPNSRIAGDGQLGSLSLLMKGESIPASQAWEGAPIAPRRDRRRSPFAPLEHSESSENNSTSTLAVPRPKGDGSRSASKATAKTLVGDAQTDKEKASEEV